jgi:hypothetical protein
MPIRVHGQRDPVIQRIRVALEGYLGAHPRARIDLYRRNPVSVRVRVVDPDFDGVGPIRRHKSVWHYLEPLPAEAVFHVSLVLPLTPDERADSFGDAAFERDLAVRKRRKALASFEGWLNCCCKNDPAF